MLLLPGRKDGETKVVRETNGAINAYVWSMQVWMQRGEESVERCNLEGC